MIVTLTDHAVKFGIKVVVLLLTEQLAARGDDIGKLPTVILDLGDVILRLIAQLGGGVDVLKAVQSIVQVAVGILDIGLVEYRCLTIALGGSQTMILLLGLIIVALPQVAVSLAIEQILIGIKVLCGGSHERVTEHCVVPVATIEVVVTNLHLCRGGQRAVGVLIDKGDERIQTLAFASLKQCQGHQQLGLFFSVSTQRQLLQVGQLVDGSHIVVAVVHESCPFEVSLGTGIHHCGLCACQQRQSQSHG